MNEAAKNTDRRWKNGDFAKYFKGDGIDIGCGPWPVTRSCAQWDLKNGDAQFMKSIEDETFDWVHASHVLEHVESVGEALRNWYRILKPNGYMIVCVPDFWLYEHGIWPSQNVQHLHSFTPTSLMRDLDDAGLRGAQLIRLQLNDSHFNYADHESDQTLGKAQAEIEMIIRKQPDLFWTGELYD